MKQKTNKVDEPIRRKANPGVVKYIVIGTVLSLVIIACIIIIPKVVNKNKSTRVVTYTVSEVTEGSVTQTISGSGNLSPISKSTLTASFDGEVEALNTTAGSSVSSGAVIARVGGEDITSPFTGVVLEVNVKAGQTVQRGTTIATIMSKEGFTMGIAVDETEISSIALNQEVTFKIDAIGNDEYTGYVSAVSYNGSSNGGSVAYSITASVDYIKGVYPGMSASASIIIEDSGEGILVPVNAVLTSGDESYVYLAKSGSSVGDVFDEEDIDVSKLEKVTVKTGMSDGTYILITGTTLEEGDLILIRKVTSTVTESSSSSSSPSGFMGGGGGGFNFSDFDFGSFDPSNRPSGGFDFGGR